MAKYTPSHERNSSPIFISKTTLKSLQAQKIMGRIFSRAADSLFRVDVILRIIGKEEDIDALEEAVSKIIGKSSDALKEELERVSKLLADNGIDTLPEYTAPKDYEVQITSPLVSQYLALIRTVDELIQRTDALWLTQVISSAQRSNGVFSWQQHVIRVGRRLVEAERMAWRAAREIGKEQEARDATGMDEAQIEADTAEELSADAEDMTTKKKKTSAKAKAADKEESLVEDKPLAAASA
jgi:hypothetical protein